MCEYSEASGGGLPVAAAHQWVSTTACRTAGDPYSWMQAVHWIAGSGLHQPKRGPRFGETTVQIAQLLAELTPCRPGIDYLMRRTGLSERSVQYHLAALRDMGLLAYTYRGTRRRGATPLASEFVRVIPPAFDSALGIRTVGEGVQRRPVGIAEEHRGTIAKLARKAARKVRGRRARKSLPAKARCTPMQGGSTGTSSADRTSSPLEAKLASGEAQSPAPKKSKREPRKLNRVGRRFQVARELIARVPWLTGASVPRTAWVVADVADAGWTVDEIEAWLDLEAPPVHVRRMSGLLAKRLSGAVGTWPTKVARDHARASLRDSRTAERARHAETWDGGWTAPSNLRIVSQALAGVRAGIAAYEAQCARQGLIAETRTPAADLDDEQAAAAAIAAFLGA